MSPQAPTSTTPTRRTVLRRALSAAGFAALIVSMTWWKSVRPPSADMLDDEQEQPDPDVHTPTPSTLAFVDPDYLMATWVTSPSDDAQTAALDVSTRPLESLLVQDSSWLRTPGWTTPSDTGFIAGAVSSDGSVWGSWDENDQRVIGFASPSSLTVAHIRWEPDLPADAFVRTAIPTGAMALHGSTLVWVIEDADSGVWGLCTWDTSASKPARLIFTSTDHAITRATRLSWTCRPVITSNWVVMTEAAPAPSWMLMCPISGNDIPLVRSLPTWNLPVVSRIPGAIRDAGSSPWGPVIGLPGAAVGDVNVPDQSMVLASPLDTHGQLLAHSSSVDARSLCALATRDDTPVIPLSMGAGVNACIVSISSSEPERWHGCVLLTDDQRALVCRSVGACQVVTSSASKGAAVLHGDRGLTYLSPDGAALYCPWNEDLRASSENTDEDNGRPGHRVLVGSGGHVAVRLHPDDESWTVLAPPYL